MNHRGHREHRVDLRLMIWLFVIERMDGLRPLPACLFILLCVALWSLWFKSDVHWRHARTEVQG